MHDRPKVGVAAIVRKDGKILLGKRTGSHGSGTWCFPGGHLEFGEDVTACAVRETLEETGIEICNEQIGPYTNDRMEHEGTHYITLYVIADHASGEPIVREPDKCTEWRWCSWEALPNPLFIPVAHLLKSGFNPF